MLRRALAQLSAGSGSLSWRVQPCLAIAARGLKDTTGIVGLPVDPEARQHLREKLEEIVAAVTVIPAEAEYRRVVEKTVAHRLAAVNSDLTNEQLEEQYDAQLEQQIRMCESELRLIPKMAEWKPWEVPEGYKVEIVEEQELLQQMDEKK